MAVPSHAPVTGTPVPSPPRKAGDPPLPPPRRAPACQGSPRPLPARARLSGIPRLASRNRPAQPPGPPRPSTHTPRGSGKPRRRAGREGAEARGAVGMRGSARLRRRCRAGRPPRRLPGQAPLPPGSGPEAVPSPRPLALARSLPCQRQHGRGRGRAPPRRIFPAARADGARAGPGATGRRFGPVLRAEAAKPKWRRLLLHRERAPGAPPAPRPATPPARPHLPGIAPPPGGEGAVSPAVGGTGGSAWPRARPVAAARHRRILSARR